MKKLALPLSAALILMSHAALAGNLLNYTNVIDVNNSKGTTFLSLMLTKIKPALDAKATRGFLVADGRRVSEVLRNVGGKVSSGALKAAGSERKLVGLADQLSRENKNVSFYTLPDAIAKAGFPGGRYELNTFFGLASEGGVAVQFDENNITYNVNYGTGKNKDDEKTGRSFGESVNSKANDASDKSYLQSLEAYTRGDQANTENFYRAILQILLNNDGSSLREVSPEGQAVAADFLAVYIAEQDRHIMSNFRTHQWDEALLEVTLLSAFHSGQSKVMVMYNGELTDTTFQQINGCDAANSSNRKKKSASMTDYWQYSSSTDPANCKRSGINVTRRDFRALEEKLTKYQRAANPQLVAAIEKELRVKNSRNLFADLTAFLINPRTPSRLDAATLKLADDFTAFLMAIQEQADATSMQITSGKL